MAEWISEALSGYMRRVKAAPGRNGLTRNQNKVLRAHPETVDIIHRTITHMIEWELLVDLRGMVHFTRMELYNLLCEIEDDWVAQVPGVEYRGNPYDPIMQFLQTGEMELPGEWGPTVVFERKPRFTFSAFSDAVTIAKKVGLFGCHRHVSLHQDFLKRLRSLRRKQRIPDPTTISDVEGGLA